MSKDTKWKAPVWVPSKNETGGQYLVTDHAYVEKDMSVEDRLIHGGMSCVVCGKVRKAHAQQRQTAGEQLTGAKTAQEGQALLAIDSAILTMRSLKIYLQEIEEKASVCWRELGAEIEALERVRGK